MKLKLRLFPLIMVLLLSVFSLASTGIAAEEQKAEQQTEAAASGLVNINDASQSELEALPGIGPVTAEAIIKYRENKAFESVEELKEVSGIGPKKFDQIKDLVSIE